MVPGSSQWSPGSAALVVPDGLELSQVALSGPGHPMWYHMVPDVAMWSPCDAAKMVLDGLEQ